MAVFEIISDSYSNPSCILNELNYIRNPEKSLYKGSYNMFEPTDNSLAALIQCNQFSYIKSYYRKHSGKQLEHFVLSFDSTDEEHDISFNTMASIADNIPYFLLCEYQTAYSIHKPHSGNMNYHIHFIMNSTNIWTGEQFRLTKSNFYAFMNSIADLLRPHGIALRGYSYFDAENRFHKGKCDELALYGKTMTKYAYY